jgi:hypothetical protein
MKNISETPILTYSVALSQRANYTDWVIATYRRNLVPTFVDRGVSRGQRGGSPMVVNLSFLDGAETPIEGFEKGRSVQWKKCVIWKQARKSIFFS